MESEIWKDVIGFEEYYEVSSFGRVRSKDRIMPHATNGKMMTVKSKILSQTINKKGYHVLHFSVNKKKTFYSVHRVVAKAFIENSNMEVNHRDGNKSNNRPYNLEFTTRSGNIKHSFDTGLRSGYKGTDNNRAKLTEDNVREIIELRKNTTISALAKKFNVSETSVSYILQGKSWNNVTNLPWVPSKVKDVREARERAASNSVIFTNTTTEPVILTLGG